MQLDKSQQEHMDKRIDYLMKRGFQYQAREHTKNYDDMPEMFLSPKAEDFKAPNCFHLGSISFDLSQKTHGSQSNIMLSVSKPAIEPTENDLFSQGTEGKARGKQIETWKVVRCFGSDCRPGFCVSSLEFSTCDMCRYL